MEKTTINLNTYQNFPVDAITSRMPLTSSLSNSGLDSTPLNSQVQHYFSITEIVNTLYTWTLWKMMNVAVWINQKKTRTNKRKRKTLQLQRFNTERVRIGSSTPTWTSFQQHSHGFFKFNMILYSNKEYMMCHIIGYV